MVPPACLRSAIALLIVVFLAAGCGGSGGSSASAKVSPDKYVSTVCSAISPLERDVVTRSSALNNTTATNATQAKRTLQGFLTAVEQDSEHALTQIKSAGTPDISKGDAVSGTIIRAFTELRNAMKIASNKAVALPTDSAASFKTAAQALGTSVKGSLNNIDASGLSNPDLEKAAAKQAACKNLNG
jgi:hypothetical protein